MSAKIPFFARLLSLILSLILFATVASPAHAELYKWRGPDGKVIYADTPPPAGTKAESLNIRNDSPPNTPESANTELQRLREKGAELQKQRKVNEAIAQKEQKEQDDRARAKRLCDNAQKRKTEALNAGDVRVFNGKRFVFLADRARQIEQATVAAEIACRK
jgi:hypothetical protein